MKKTTILVEIETRKQLRKLGDKGDTYDDIIKRLMAKAKGKHEK